MYAYLSVPVEIKEQLLFGSKQIKLVRFYFWLLQGFRLFLKEIKKWKREKKRKKSASFSNDALTSMFLACIREWWKWLAADWPVGSLCALQTFRGKDRLPGLPITQVDEPVLGQVAKLFLSTRCQPSVLLRSKEL